MGPPQPESSGAVAAPADARPTPVEAAPRVAVVQWTGGVGGSEVWSVTVCAALRRIGVDAEMVFVTNPGSHAARLTRTDVPARSLGLRRGRDVLLRPRGYAALVARSGPDGALIAECGYMGVALRAGGYRAPIVAVEHGSSLLPLPTGTRRLLRRASRLTAALVDDAEVGVSDWMVERMRAGPHARRLVRIYNGIDPAEFDPGRQPRHACYTAGFAGRLVGGKGADHLIRAFAEVRRHLPARLLIAGDGPARGELERLAQSVGADAVEFLGMLQDMPGFWARCDVAAFPADRPESFGMAPLEAMACGKPVIAARSGALPELVADGATGKLVPPGDVPALARALVSYGEDPGLSRAHGAAGRERAVESFSIDACAAAYRDIFCGLAPGRRR